jgi:hypothetical protein
MRSDGCVLKKTNPRTGSVYGINGCVLNLRKKKEYGAFVFSGDPGLAGDGAGHWRLTKP